jgi:hypothetical protein
VGLLCGTRAAGHRGSSALRKAPVLDPSNARARCLTVVWELALTVLEFGCNELPSESVLGRNRR